MEMMLVVFTDVSDLSAEMIFAGRRKPLLLNLFRCFLICFTLILALTPATPLWAAADPTWYNTTDTSFTLTTADQLAGLAELVNGGNNFSGKTVYLGNDISLLGYQAGDGWTPIGTYTPSCPFRGT
ncbi:MAG: hypothetical protein LBQ19_00145, partial [Synergistaceae bacterium]|nr:hypothetical protein [Synergistaceae bacterium]